VEALQVGTLVLLAGSLGFLLVLVGRRSWLATRARRRNAAIQALRPAAIELVEDVGDPPPLRGFKAAVFAELLSGYALAVRGAPRERIAAYFERTGAVDEQLRLLRSRRGWKRASAAFALGDMGSRLAVPALLVALDDPDADVRAAASRSLGRIGPDEAIEPLVTAGVERRVPRDVAMLALLDIGPPAVPRLFELTRHAEPRVRTSAVELVGLLGEAGDAEELPALLRDTAAEVRAATAGALGRLGAAAALDALVEALDDRVPSVRVASARALGQIGGRSAVDALLRVARTDEFEPAAAAAGAAAAIDPAFVIRAAGERDAGPHLHEAADLAAL
jgi:HEAT repeat protein